MTAPTTTKTATTATMTTRRVLRTLMAAPGPGARFTGHPLMVGWAIPAGPRWRKAAGSGVGCGREDPVTDLRRRDGDYRDPQGGAVWIPKVGRIIAPAPHGQRATSLRGAGRHERLTYDRHRRARLPLARPVERRPGPGRQPGRAPAGVPRALRRERAGGPGDRRPRVLSRPRRHR